MKVYDLRIDIDAVADIQRATDWYNEQLPGLGSRFQAQVITQLNALKRNHLTYSVRYKTVRCMLVKRYPYLVQFSIDNNRKVVEILAVFHTSRNPRIWLKRRRPKK